MEEIQLLIEAYFKETRKKYSPSLLKNNCEFNTGNNAFTIIRILESYKIYAKAYAIDKDELAEFIEVFQNVILHTEKGWILITGMFFIEEEMHVEFTSMTEKGSCPLKKLLPIYSGAVIAIEDDNFEEPANQIKQFKQKDKENQAITLITLITFTLLVIFFINTNNEEKLFYNLISLLSFIGLYFAYMLIKQEYGTLPPLIANACNPKKSITADSDSDVEKNSKEGKTSVLSCQDVAKSDKSRFELLGTTIRWSDTAFSFFLFQVIFLIYGLNANTQETLQTMLYIQLFTIPIPIVSLLAQISMRKYCFLCLAVSAVIVVQIANFAYYFYRQDVVLVPIHFHTLVLVLLVASTAVLALIYLRKYFRSNTLIKQYLRNFALLLTNHKTIQGHLEEMPKNLKITSPHLQVGQNKNNLLRKPYDMLFVTNPFCMPCAMIQYITDTIKHKCNTGYFFTWFDEKGRLAAQYLTALAFIDADLFHHSLRKWYKLLENREVKPSDDDETIIKKIQEIASIIIPKKYLSQADQRLKDQTEWLDAANVKATPTIYINFYQVDNRLFNVLPYVLITINKLNNKNKEEILS